MLFAAAFLVVVATADVIIIDTMTFVIIISRPERIIPAFHEKYICLFRDYKRLGLKNQHLHSELHQQALKREETRLKIEK